MMLALPSHAMLSELSLFSGIGGFSLGLGWTGHFMPLAFCENEPYCQKVLGNHWPHVPIVRDVHELSAASLIREFRINPRDIGIITAGFPCQPFSSAGQQKGAEDARFLWPELARVIFEIRPKYVFLENVPAVTSIQGAAVFRGILRTLTALGYDAEWGIIPASALDARHERKRWFLVGYPMRGRRGASAIYQPNRHIEGNAKTGQLPSLSSAAQSAGAVVHNPSLRPQADTAARSLQPTQPNQGHRGERPAQSRLGRATHGVSSRLDGARWDVSRPGEAQYDWEPPRVADGVKRREDRLRGLGNAVFPPVIAAIGQRIWEHHTGVREYVMGDGE